MFHHGIMKKNSLYFSLSHNENIFLKVDKFIIFDILKAGDYMSLFFTVLFAIAIVAGVGYGSFLVLRKVYRKLSNWLSPYLGVMNLSKQQKEALVLAQECMANNMVQVGEKEEDPEHPGQYKSILLVFKNEKVSIGYQYKRTSDVNSLDDVSMMMYVDNSDKYVDANSLKSKPLMMIVDQYLSQTKVVQKAMDDEYLFEQMRSRKNSSSNSGNV